MRPLYYLDRKFEVVCCCCGKKKPDCRLVWVDPSNLRFLCVDCVGVTFPFFRELGIEIKKGGD